MEAEDEDEDHFGNKDPFDSYTSESPNTKRKIESAYGLFCVMRKRTCRHNNSVDDVVDDSGSGSDADLSECSEFDVLSQHVVEDENFSCNFPCPSEDEETLVNKLSSANEDVEENGVRSKENQVLALEKMSSNDNITLVGKDDEPIPISSVPPDGGSSILLETFSLHPVVRCLNEYDVHDGKIGLEISPIPSTKTFEGPSRPWSICGSVAAVRNIPLLEDGSGACSSLDEKLYVNVSGSEYKDAKISQTSSTLYQEEEVDGEDEISFSDIDAMIRKLNLVPDDSDSWLNREEWNMSEHPRQTLLGLEHCTRTSIRRAVITQGALAVLNCRDSKHFIRKHEVIIGRSSYGMNVDIDLGKEGYGSKISRRQALVKLVNNGSFSLTNLGKRHILINGEKLNTGQIVSLTSCSSSIDIRGIVFEFKINKEAVRQFLKNNTRRNSKDDTKFKWCE